MSLQILVIFYYKNDNIKLEIKSSSADRPGISIEAIQLSNISRRLIKLDTSAPNHIIVKQIQNRAMSA